MKVLIISDSHGRTYRLDEVLERVYDYDMVIHLGDICGDENYLRKKVNCPLYMIAGNNDFNRELNKEEIIEIEGKQILLTHGHKYGVNYGIEYLIEEAQSIGMDMVMFGHTHIPLIMREEELVVINPGSLTFPRQDNHKGSFVVLEIDSEKKFHFSLDYLE